MELENEVFNRILKHLALKNPLAFKNKGLDQLKKSISVLHYDYLIGASKELGIMLQKYPNKENEINNLFDFLMHFYNKRTKTHHMLFLWIHFFETALRSKMAVILAQKHSSKVNNLCLYHILKSYEKDIMKLGVGSGLKNIQLKALKDFEIPLPPLNEQSAIASILSALDNEIASLKNKKRQFENIKKALNHDLMSAKIRVLKK
ncbi:hypothetical protein HpHNI37_01370 [Helicobacter pylori]